MRSVLIGLLTSQILGCSETTESESTEALTTLMVSDSFTGSGALTAHHPNIGSGWVKVYDTLGSDAVLNGGVLKAKLNGAGKGQAYAAKPDPTVPDQHLEIRLWAP